MGKRSDFKRNQRDFYATPAKAVDALLPHLDPCTLYTEPCAGDGALVRHLSKAGHICVHQSDVLPLYPWVEQKDATKVVECMGSCFITNPPWDREVLHPMIIALSNVAPTWLLFDSDWAFTAQSSEYMTRCRKIVAVGRQKWIPNTKMTGKDNCAWYLFSHPSSEPTEFHGR